MDTTLNHLVTTDVKSDLMDTRQESLLIMIPEISSHISHDESILDLSQRTSTSMKIENPTKISVLIDHWPNSSLTNMYTDTVDASEWQLNASAQNQKNFNLEQSLTDQYQHNSIKEDSMSDSAHKNPSLLDVASSIKKINRQNSRRIVIREHRPCLNQTPCSPSDFLWSTFFSVIGERPVADEFFDHYLASVESSLEIDMKLEYCYDVQRDLYWLTQIQLVSHSLILLHYVGLPEDDTSNDFWAYLYEKRCHPIGWCKENSKLMIPPPIVTKRAILQQNNCVPTTTCTSSNGTIKSSMTDDIHNDTKNGSSPFVPSYLFNQNIGLTPSEQLHVGMLLEIQDLNCPWTLWFVRIIGNRGGRLHLRYVTKLSANDDEHNKEDIHDIHIFYLDHRVHTIGWRSINPSIYSYDIPSNVKSISDKQSIIDFCLNESKIQFLPPHVFKEQEEINKHRFIEGMKLEVFEPISQQIYVGHIGHIHNEFYFDVLIDHIDDNSDNNLEKSWSFVAHSKHPHILPPHWAAEHKLILMKGKDHRQSDDYWNDYTETHGIDDLAPDKCFNLITLNATGSNRMEPGMKMEMIYTIKGNDLVFSVTLIHVADHLMWLRVDNPNFFEDEHLFYHVLPINSLDVFPVGWAKFNGFELVLPLQYQTISNNYEIDLRQIFSSITHHPKIPKIYLSDIDLLTIYVNIHCFSGPHFCSSRLARIPSKFGPGPYRQVLIDMFHHLLPTASTSAHRALRRLDHQNHSEKNPKMDTEQIKAAKKSSKLIRPVTIPTDPQLIHRYLRHICSQLEACPNLISIQSIEQLCPDKCHRLKQTFAFSSHLKHKRTGLAQLRAAQTRQKKQKSLLSHCKTSLNSILNGPTNQIDESNLLETTSEMNTNHSINELDISSTCDRQTRGFRFHIEPRTHTITRTNRKQKINRQNEEKQSNVSIQKESIQTQNILLSNVSQSSLSTEHLVQESKSIRSAKKKRSFSPESVPSISSSTDLLPSNKIKRNRRSPPNIPPANLIENSSSSSSSSSTFELNSFPLGSIQKNDYEINSSLVSTTSQSNLSSVDSRNPMTWNVNDVCWYLNKCGCSFALKTIKEQEIDGAALLLLDDLNTVQDLLDFKLGPAVKFFHVVEQLRSRVIETVHSPPSLRSSSRLSSSSSSSTRTS